MQPESRETGMGAPDWTQLIAQLSEPFPASAIYWRAGAVSRDKKRAQALPYAEPRVYEDRLNAVCPGLWGVTFRPWGEGRLICELSIAGLTRSSTGEENDGFAPGTAAEAQAFKRACSKFGLGRYLYDIPITWVDYDDEHKRLSEIPSLSERFLPGAAGNEEPVGSLLTKGRAQAMYRELEKLGLGRVDAHKLAKKVLNRDVSSFEKLSESEALEVWNSAKRESPRHAA